MTLLAAAKALIVLGCLDPSRNVNSEDCKLAKPNCEGCVQNWLCAPPTAKSLRAAADAMEWNEKRERECPKAKEDFRKAVKESQ